MTPRLICIALFLACSFGCSRDSTPVSAVNQADGPLALTQQDVQVHTIVVITQELDSGRDGIDQTNVIKTSYDHRGNALVVEEASTPHGVQRRVTRSSYNKWGNVLEQVIDTDWRENGPKDSRYWITTVEMDNLGRPSHQVYLLDYDFDGVPDHEGPTRSYPEYDHRGQPLQEILDNDNDGDGALETRTTQAMVYDQHGNIVQMNSESDWEMDGTSEYGFSDLSTYNVHGEVVHSTSESYELGEGVARSTLTTSEFDNRGNPVVRVLLTDYAPADGVVDARRVLTSSFDQRNRPLRLVTDIDAGNDGTFEGRITRTYEYFGTLAPQSASMGDNRAFSVSARERHHKKS